MARIIENEAINGRNAYSLIEMMTDLRKGIFKEIYNTIHPVSQIKNEVAKPGKWAGMIYGYYLGCTFLMGKGHVSYEVTCIIVYCLFAFTGSKQDLRSYKI